MFWQHCVECRMHIERVDPPPLELTPDIASGLLRRGVSQGVDLAAFDMKWSIFVSRLWRRNCRNIM